MSDTFVGQQAGALGVRQTRFRDVCGSIDELKRVLYEEPALAAQHPEALDALIDDALYMLARMEQRLAEYEVFRDDVVAAAAALQTVGASRRQEAAAAAPRLRALLRADRPLAGAEREAAVAVGEAIRDVAQDIENKLSRYKTLALALAQAYRAVKGDRAWVLDEGEAEAAPADPLPGEPHWARWLPPSPHRERIVRHLRAGRGHLLTRAELAALRGVAPEALPDDEPPWVQFSDGGVMALPQVRWSDDLRNFYAANAAGTAPHPNGRRYRDYVGRQVHPAGAAPPGPAGPG